MRLREKVSLILTAVIIYKTACSLSLPQLTEENPFEKYMKAKRGKVQNLPRNALHGTENGRKSMDVLSDSAILNELRKEERRKRKHKPNEKVYSRDDLPTPVLPDIFHNQEQSFYFNEMGSFPEVQYPLSASETWAPSYWHQLSSNKQEVSSYDYSLQNRKQKKQNTQAFLQPSIMKAKLKELEKNAELSLKKKIKLGEKENIDEMIVINKNSSSSEPNATQIHTQKVKQPLSRKKPLKKIVPKVQQALTASKKIVNETDTAQSKSKQVNQETESNKRANNKHGLRSKNATNITTNLLNSNENNVDSHIDTTLINTIKTIDLSSSHISTDEDSNQLELLLAVTASEHSLEERNNGNNTIENQVQTTTPDIVLFSDAVRQSIFDVLSTEKLNASSLRDNILKILLSEEPQFSNTHSIEEILKSSITNNLTSGDSLDLRGPIDSITVPLVAEELSNKPKNVSSDTLWSEIHQNDNIEATKLPTETISEKQMTEDATWSSKVSSPSSTDNVSDPFTTNDLADNLRDIISKPSNSHALVDDLREIIRLLTLWNSQIEDVEVPNHSTKNTSPEYLSKGFLVASSSLANLTDSTTKTVYNNTERNQTNDRPVDISLPTNIRNNEIRDINQIDDSPLTRVYNNEKYDESDKVTVLNLKYLEEIHSKTKSDTEKSVRPADINSLHTPSYNPADVYDVRTPVKSNFETLIDQQTNAVPATLVNKITTNDWSDITPVVALSDYPSDDMSTSFLTDALRISSKNYQSHLNDQTKANYIIVIPKDKQSNTPNDGQPTINLHISLIDAATDDQADKSDFNASDNLEVDNSGVVIAVSSNYSMTNVQNGSLNDTVPKTTSSDILTDIKNVPESKMHKTSVEDQTVMIPSTATVTDDITINNKTYTDPKTITNITETDMAHPSTLKTTFKVEEIEKPHVNDTDINESTDQKPIEKPEPNHDEVVFDPISFKNDETLPTSFLTFTGPTTVSSLAQQYAKSLLSFISNYFSIRNTLTENLINNQNQSRSSISDESLVNNTFKKADLLNENFLMQVSDKNTVQLKPNYLGDNSPANKTLSEPASELITISNNDSITSDQHFNDTFFEINSPTKFTFNDLLYDKNDSVFPISLVTAYVPDDKELLKTSQSVEKPYLPPTEYFMNENKLESDKQSINNVCPIMQDTSIENQCYIYEQPDAFNKSRNLTDISGEWLASNVDMIKSLPKDNLNKDTSISKEMLDFTDYYTISPEDTTTDDYDFTLSSEYSDTKNNYHEFTAPLHENNLQVTTNNLLDEQMIMEDSDYTKLIEDKEGRNYEETQPSKLITKIVQRNSSTNLEKHDAIDKDFNLDNAESFDDGVDNSSHESYLDKEITNNSKNVPENQENNELSEISHYSKKDEHSKLITDKPLLWGVFPKLDFLL